MPYRRECNTRTWPERLPPKFRNYGHHPPLEGAEPDKSGFPIIKAAATGKPSFRLLGLFGATGNHSHASLQSFILT
jgi:hypothetical protein